MFSKQPKLNMSKIELLPDLPFPTKTAILVALLYSLNGKSP